MRKLTYALNSAFFTFYRTTFFILFVATISQSVSGQCTPENNSISGTVFEDILNDGIFKDADVGISSVLVKAYDADGNNVGSSVSDVNGIYSIENLPNGKSFRLIFENSSSYYSAKIGQDNRSSVQFVKSPACNVNYGLTRTNAGCGVNPDLVLTCFVQGTIAENATVETIISVEHDFTPMSQVSKLATHSETGSIWGITHDAQTEALYSASFVKQYAGLKYTPYTILKTELTGDKKTSAFVDVNALIPQNLQGLAVTNVKDCAYGNQVGRVGLGSIIISPDGEKLYTAVLDEGLVVGVNIENPSPATTEVFYMPRPVNIDPAEEYRIFALKWYEEKIYVGGTVTASVSKDKNVSSAVIMTLDPKTGVTQEIFRTNYIQGHWQDTQPASLKTSHWLTDLDFTDSGEIMMSLTDRIGHRYCKASTNRLDQQFPDLLIIGYDEVKKEWILEDNGSINGRPGSGVGNGQGPGGGEFFGFDFWPTDPSYHSETALGSVFALPGSSEVIVSVYDPMTRSYSGGLHRYNTVDGSKSGAIELYSHNINTVFGKATGFGDIIGVCNTGSIEIGNYVWNDTNGNGLQDPGEEGIPDIGLNLYNEDCELIGSTATDENGNYAFNDSNVDSDGDGIFDGVFPDITYYVQVDNAIYDEVTGLYTIGTDEYTICTAHSGSPDDDNIDCDAEYDPTSCLSTAFIEVNTGTTNHTFDIGLGEPSGFDLALKKEIVGNQFAKVGEEVIFMITVYNQGGVSASSVTITDYMSKGYSFDPQSNNGWDLVDGVLESTINQKLLPGQNVSKILKLVIVNTKAANYLNIAEISKALDLAGEPAFDVDSTPDTNKDNDRGGEPFTSTDDQLNGNGEDDEDDHDPAVPKIFDLAVRMTLEDDKYYYADDVVKFDIRVFNQGNVAADLVELTNYFPKEFSLNTELSTGWDVIGVNAIYRDFEILEVGEVRDYSIYFTIAKGILPTELVAYVEISESSPVDFPGSCDFDSYPDNSNDNDMGGEIYTSTDNEVDDHGAEDEDDHDPAVIKSKYVDLALMKTAVKKGVRAGEDVVFDIEIINQGTAPIQHLEIVDYIPENMTLNDNNWTLLQNGNASRVIELDNPLTKGQKTNISIVLKIDDDISPRSFVNYAEITGARNADNLDIGGKDIDSTPDDDVSNDKGGIPDSDTDNTVDSSRDVDEDDHDPARVSMISGMLQSSECLENATNSTNGQFEDVFKITGPAGEKWYLFDEANYYDISSPDPGDGPLVELEAGDTTVIMTEIAIDALMSMYTFSAIREDGKDAFISFRNLNTDDIESFNVSAMMYEDIIISGDQALCQGQTKVYCVANPDPDVDYEWTADAPFIIISPTCIEIDWSAVAPDMQYNVGVEADGGCNVPGAITVSIGTSSGAMSCLGTTNLSLDGDCEVQVTPSLILTSDILPGQAYSVMLTTESGEVIPNATLTSEHIGTTVTAKVIDGCSGNACWGTIFVEDKIKPTIECIDAYISCNKVDEFGGPFAEDNCGGPVEVIMLNETFTPLQCADYSARIERTYQAVDEAGNVSEICEMTIYVELIVLADIKFPDNFTMMEGTALSCNEYDLDIDGVADLDVTGRPTYNGEYVYPEFDPLCNTGITFEDEVRFIGGIKKITRTWTAWNWYCSETKIREHKQYIEIRDTEDPIIVCPMDMTISAAVGNCEGIINLPLPIVTDECTDDVDIKIQILTPVTSIINDGDSRVVSFPFSLTPYDITYRATDLGGNSAECIMKLTVVDDIAPIAICDKNTIVGLNSNGEGYLYAMNLDDGSYDACQLMDMKIRRVEDNGPFADKVLFTCDDLGAPVMVELRVEDGGGLTNSCMATVVVQDKHAPEVDDLPDMVIECGDSYTPLSQFGVFTYNDACNVTTVEDSIIAINSCGTGTITRTFTATDSDGSDIGFQTITIINSNPFDEDDIVSWPPDYDVTITTCDDDDLHPDNLPAPFNYPVWIDDACDQVSAGFHDDIYPLLNDPNSVCYKIVRKWTIIDWCQLDSNDDPLEFNDIQIIKVKNTKKPDPIVVTPEIDTVVSPNCDTGLLNFTATSDDCAPDLLNWSIQVDYDQDFLMTGVYDLVITGFGPVASINEEVPQGTHNIVFSFSNGCGNTETTSKTVTILNNIAPTIVCQKTIVALGPWNIDDDPEPDTEAACIWVSDLVVDSSTVHQCDTPFELSFSQDSIVKKMCFDCNNIGLNSVTVYAIDIYGNVSFCIDTVEVQDNNDIDICVDLKDCVSEIQDTTISLQSGCIVFVNGTDFDVSQINNECGDLTITNNLTGTSTLSGAQLMLGANNIIWTINSGPMSIQCPQKITVIDEIDPTISCGADITVSTSDFDGCEYVHSGSGLDPGFNDNCNIADVYHNYLSAPSTFTLDGAAFPIGVTEVLWTVEDEAGNSDTCTVTITVIEGLEVPCNTMDITIDLDENGQASITQDQVFDLEDTECGGIPTVTVEPTMFDCGMLGVNPVTITLHLGEDSLVCTAMVTVQDLLFPSITCAPDFQITDIANGDLGCSHTITDNNLDPVVISDNCDNFIVTHNYGNAPSNTTLNGATFFVGNMDTVLWTITEIGGFGQSSTCDIVVTVVDNQDPNCVDQGIIPLTLSPGEEITLDISLLPNPYTDNCEIESYSFNPPTLDCTNEGLNDVTVTVTDVNMNTSECMVVFDVTVEEEVSCSLNISTAYLSVTGDIQLVAAEVVDITGGLCGVEIVPSLSDSVFLCNDINFSPIDITIFANGDSCGMASLIIADTIGPEVYCSPITISCMTFENVYNNSLTDLINQTEAVDSIWDNCAATLITTTSIDTSDLNGCNYGMFTRTTIVEDPLSEKFDTCVQVITIQGPVNPLTQGELNSILPDTVIVDECTGGSFVVDTITIQDLETFVGCGEFNLSNEDVSISEGCPDTIIRTYTIEAICQDEILIFEQLIVINDEEDPVLTSTVADTSIIFDLDCVAALDISSMVSATDNCTSSDMLNITYSYDDVVGSVDSIIYFEFGNFNVTITAEDGCGNTDTATFDVMIVDTIPLFVTCIKVIVDIDTITQTVSVPASQNMQITGNCDNEADLYFSYDTLNLSDTLRTFNCDDVGNAIKVDLYAWEIVNGDTIPYDLVPDDTTAVLNLCKGEIEINDSDNACTGTILGIVGEISTPEGIGIPNYSLILNGSGLDPIYSDSKGEYAFPLMPFGGSYNLTTYNNNEVMNGVSTLDLIMIQRHVLGLSPFDSPYKYIAADINNNEKVSGSDLVELRKMILGIHSEFPNNMSWRTVDAAYIFPDPTDPWASALPEGYKILSLDTNMDIDFVGIKIGDVNGNVTVNAKGEASSTSRSSDAKVFKLESGQNSNLIEVYAEEGLDIVGLQFTVDLTGMKIVDILSDHFSIDQIGFNEVEEGIFNISIAGTQPVTVDANEILIEIITDCNTCDLNSMNFKLAHKGLDSELYINESIETVPLELDVRNNEGESLFVVYQNNPNPWTNFTKIDIILPQADNVNIKVYDVNGRLVSSRSKRMNAGLNSVEFDNLQIFGSGVFYYEISTSTRSERYKMIKLN